MNDIMIFDNPEFGAVRTVEKNGEPWFVAADVCKALELGDTGKAVGRLDEDELTRIKIVSGGQNREMLIVNEPGLYALVLGSRKPEAKAFKRWITHEVIPAIRKNGGYINGQNNMSPDELMAAALLMAQKTIEEQKSKLDAAHPKVLFADAVATSKNSILVGEMAKLLKQNGIDMGQNRLFEWLRTNGYLIRRQGTDYNMPTQKSMEMGLFEIKETAITHSDGHTSVSKTPKVSGKGQQYFVNMFLSQ